MSTKWRELNEDEKPQRGNEIRIPGDSKPLGTVIKVGPSGITYRPHGGGALQLISASADVEVRASEDTSEEKEKDSSSTKKKVGKETATKTKKSKAASVKPKPEPKQLEIVEDEVEKDEEPIENGEETDDVEETEDADVAPTPATAKGWMRIEELVEKSGVPLGRILKARREGAFTGMVRPDPDYTGVGRKPLIYSSAALKVAMGLSGGSGKGGRPSKSGEGSASTSTARRGRRPGADKSGARPPKRHVNQAATGSTQSHLFAAGESLQAMLEGINAEIERLMELREKLIDLWDFFEVK